MILYGFTRLGITSDNYGDYPYDVRLDTHGEDLPDDD
jgi:hypothetical protein